MDVQSFLFQVGLLLLAALLLGRLAKRLGLSALAGELAAGVLLGPTLLGRLDPAWTGHLLPRPGGQSTLLDAVGQLGMLLLVGITGTQLDLRLVRRRGLTAARISLAGVVVPMALGIVVGLLMPATLLPDSGDRRLAALFLGVAMGISAIPVIAKVLEDLNLLRRNVGQLIMCAVTVDDIVGWVLLSAVSALATTGLHGLTVARAAALPLAVVAAAWAARPLLRVAFRAAGRADGAGEEDGHAGAVSVGATVALAVVVIVIGAAATKAVGLEPGFGAFIFGIAVGSCDTLDQKLLSPLRTTVLAVLAPIFFATVGLRLDLGALARPAVALTGVVVLAVAILGKFAGAYLGARTSRLSNWEAVALGAGINARGVVEIIIATAGLKLGVLSPAMFTVVVGVAVVTSLMAPPMLRWSMAKVERDESRRLRSEFQPVSAG